MVIYYELYNIQCMPPEWLEWFYFESSRPLPYLQGDMVLLRLAEQEFLPISIMEEMLKDPNFQVREKLAKRYDTPVDILRTLSRDKSKRVSKTAISALERLGVCNI